MTGTGLKELAGLEILRDVNLSGCTVTEEGVKGIAELKQIQRVSFSEEKAPRNAADELQKALPRCEILR